MAVPQGYEAQVRPRSGLAIRHGLIVPNAPGTIDADYRGEVCVILGNIGQEAFTVKRGMRIAQMVIASVIRGQIADGSGTVAARFPVAVSGASSRTLDNWPSDGDVVTGPDCHARRAEADGVVGPVVVAVDHRPAGFKVQRPADGVGAVVVADQGGADARGQVRYRYP